MGMDIYGRNVIGTADSRDMVYVGGIGPVDQSGGKAYYRANGYWWGMVLKFIMSVAPEMSERICIPWFYDDEDHEGYDPNAPNREMFWGSNDGWGLAEDDCMELADKIDAAIDELPQDKLEEIMEEDDDVNELFTAVREFARFCRACGGFRIF